VNNACDSHLEPIFERPISSLEDRVATQRLVIDCDDKGHFCLAIDGGVVTIGDNPQDAELILRNLHVAHIHCEVEVEEMRVVVNGTKAPLGQLPLLKELLPGAAVRVGHKEIRLEAGGEARGPVAEIEGPGSAVASVNPPAAKPTDAVPAAVPVASESTGPQLSKQLVVIDGGDQGRVFALPDSGVCTIGKSAKHADIILHDLYVTRVHCALHLQRDGIRVVHVEGQNGTLIDGQQITEQMMKVGSVLRVGNSHLRLETVVRTEPSAAPSRKDVAAGGPPGLSPVEPVAEDVEEVVELEEVAAAEEVVDAQTAKNITDAVTPETAEANSTSERGEEYALPHSPIDDLLKIENQTFGHFKIECLLGRGQTGLVFRAQDLQRNQVVTLKVLSPDFPADDPELQQFIAALKVLPHLAHPNLVTLYRAGRAGPHCWIAREYVDGESVMRVIHRVHTGESAGWTQACGVILDLCKALQFLQEHKVTHGNVTPRNILLTKDGAAKLADLMLSRALLGSRLHNVIAQKKLLAEAVFLAPEQLLPQGSVDPRTDLYALGVVAYALLTGQPPFSGSSLREIATQIRETTVIKPSRQRPGIPLLLEAIVLKMMARRREDRFQSAAEVLAYVEPFAEDHGIAV
jgi:hypothetical protein